MKSSSLDSHEIFRLTPKIEILPVRHGSGDFAQEIREYLLSRHIDCLAIPLPPSVEHLVEKGISCLPTISLVGIPEAGELESSSYSYIPIDPCQPIIIRVAPLPIVPTLWALGVWLVEYHASEHATDEESS